MKQFNPDNNVYYALITPIEGTWGFTSYQDRNGDTYRAINGFTPTGQPKNFSIYWGSSERIYYTPKSKKITVLVNNSHQEEKLLVEYIENSPNCEGSPNNTPEHPILFKRLDEQRDAELKVDRRRRRNDAIAASLKLEGQDLIDFAVLLGEFRQDKMLLIDRVSEYASQDPEGFFKVYNDPTRQTKALVRKALHENKLKKTGESIFWGQELLGGNEDQAVSYLLAQPEKMKGLQESINYVPQTNINAPKKGPGRPKKEDKEEDA
jgi:hypothetical protein